MLISIRFPAEAALDRTVDLFVLGFCTLGCGKKINFRRQPNLKTEAARSGPSSSRHVSEELFYQNFFILSKIRAAMIRNPKTSSAHSVSSRMKCIEPTYLRHQFGWHSLSGESDLWIPSIANSCRQGHQFFLRCQRVFTPMLCDLTSR